MLSRVADSIYWMARYMERAENLARLLVGSEGTLAFSAAHTPYQPAAPGLASSKSTKLGNTCAGNATDDRALMTQMVEGIDTELQRVLVETGIATKSSADTNP